MHARHFDEYEAECRPLPRGRLPLAAYDYVLKCSHAFNLLDARGAIAVTDRGRLHAVACGASARPSPPMYLEVEEQGA